MKGRRRISGGALLLVALSLHLPHAFGAPAAGGDVKENRREGARIYLQSCLPCHSLKYVRLRQLEQLGFTGDDVAAMLPGSRFDTPLNSYIAPSDAERVFGLAPPDLSLMAKAREAGREHISSLLTSYTLDDSGTVVNTWLPGIRMPDILSYAVVKDPAWKQELERRAVRVSDFLDWAADPTADARKRMGAWVIAYLVLLTVLLYLVKRRVWSGLDH